MKGVRFGNYHSWREFSLILSSKSIGSPTPKTAEVEVPGADGSLDLTEYFGEVNYKNRPLSFVFSTIVPQSEFLKLFSEIQNTLHGKKFRIILDEDPEFYYIGRVTVSEWKANKSVGEITIDCNCEPYKYKMYETIRTETISGTKEIVLNNLRKRVNPVITTNAEMNINFQNYSFSISAGTWTIPEFYLSAGKNLISIKGNGTIEFKYQERGL